MKKEELEKKAAALNTFINENQGKVLTHAELKEGLKCITAGAGILNQLYKLFPSETMGRAKMYEMPKKPIHMKRIEQCWDKHNKAVSKNWRKKHAKVETDGITEEQAIATLKKTNGFVIRKIVGYKTEELLEYLVANHPEIYRKFCIYEYV